MTKIEIPKSVTIRNGRLYTISVDSNSVYGEDVLKMDGKFYREWEPKRSKISAALKNGLRHFPFNYDTNLLYLGASSGTTVSHLSDIIVNGRIYAIELSYDPFLKLMRLAERRKNIYPILEDANLIEKYSFFVEKVGTLYQDISQRNQIQIFNSTVEYFHEIKEALLVMKIRSITSRGSDTEILKKSISEINAFSVKQIVDLKPYSVGNYMLYLERS
ncbi:MAG: fibrillarin-like rRNA/tRNA 2'-O-methyltransferase [Thermoplasmata archaeon]